MKVEIDVENKTLKLLYAEIDTVGSFGKVAERLSTYFPDDYKIVIKNEEESKNVFYTPLNPYSPTYPFVPPLDYEPNKYKVTCGVDSTYLKHTDSQLTGGVDVLYPKHIDCDRKHFSGSGSEYEEKSTVSAAFVSRMRAEHYEKMYNRSTDPVDPPETEESNHERYPTEED